MLGLCSSGPALALVVFFQNRHNQLLNDSMRELMVSQRHICFALVSESQHSIVANCIIEIINTSTPHLILLKLSYWSPFEFIFCLYQLISFRWNKSVSENQIGKLWLDSKTVTC